MPSFAPDQGHRQHARLSSEDFYLVTTLTDSTRYSASELADLYFQRWDVELFFRDIKTTMGMDVLRCRTPLWSGRKS